jgi:hypothetical protein
LPTKVISSEADQIAAVITEEATELWGCWVGFPEIAPLHDLFMLATQVVRMPAFADVFPLPLQDLNGVTRNTHLEPVSISFTSSAVPEETWAIQPSYVLTANVAPYGLICGDNGISPWRSIFVHHDVHVIGALTLSALKAIFVCLTHLAR